MTKRLSLWALGLLVTALFLVPQNAGAATCTNATLSGTYQFNSKGFGTIGGFMNFDGAGHFTFLIEALPSGQPQIVDQGTYTVNADCTMQLVFHPSNFNCYSAGPCDFPVHYDAVLVKGGTAFYMIATDLNTFTSGAAVKL